MFILTTLIVKQGVKRIVENNDRTKAGQQVSWSGSEG